MNDVIRVEDIYLQDNFIHIQSNYKLDNLYILNEHIKFKIESKDNLINLDTLVSLINIIQKKYCYKKDVVFNLAVCQSNDNSKFKYLGYYVFQSGIFYLAQNLNVKNNDVDYFVDIFIDEEKNIKIKFKKETDFVAIVDSIRMLNKKVKIEFFIKKLSEDLAINLREEDVSNFNVIIYSDNGIISKLPVEFIKNNKLIFELDLDVFLIDDEFEAGATLVYKYNLLDIKLLNTIKLKPQKIYNEKLIKNVQISKNIETENIAIRVLSKPKINPILKKVEYNNDILTIYGELNSNIDIYNHNSVETKLIISSLEQSIIIDNTVDILNNDFIFTLSKEDIFNIKRLVSGQWKVEIEINANNSCIRSQISCNEEKANIFEELISSDNDNAVVAFKKPIDSGNLVVLEIKNQVNIKSILSIIVKKKELYFRYRTKENIEDLLNKNQIITNICTNNDILKCKEIKKIGKKTYIAKYESKDSKKFLSEMLNNGLTIINIINNVSFVSYFSDFDKSSIYYNHFQRFLNSKRYKDLCIKLYYKVFSKLPIKKNRIIFESFLGRNVSGNPKYIYNYFIENGLDKKYELIWSLNDISEEIEGKVKKVKRKSLKYYYYMATSGYWVINTRHQEELIKRNGIIYLQTWHGTPLKRLGADMSNVNMATIKDINQYKQMFFDCSKQWDYLIAQNEYSANIFKRAFRFNNTMLTYGYPANDILYKKNNETEINKIKEKYGLPKDKKVILYAPTWRDDNYFKKGHYKMSIELDLEKIKNALEEDYIILLKMHYLITNSINIADYTGFAYDFSGNYDIQELYLISDILVTDYSSVMFDYANLRRPIIFYTYDLEKYRDLLRGFYFDFMEKAPGPIVKTTDEVIDVIHNIERVKEEYKDKEQEFYKYFCSLDDGNAAKRVFDEVFLQK